MKKMRVRYENYNSLLNIFALLVIQPLARVSLANQFSSLVPLLFLYQDYIEDMSDEIFNKHVGALSIKRLEKPKKLSSQNNRYWMEIINQFFSFQRGLQLFNLV